MIIRRLLIANRGEIAARVIRTCRRLGIETVLTVTGADGHSLPAALADRTVPLESGYLDVAGVVDAAVTAGADAVHPGYGFLAENPRLARACEAAGLEFIGPSAEVLETAGDKLAARECAVAAGVHVLPGGPADAAGASRLAARIGYPVLVKAVAGGGGRGQRMVADRARLPDSVAVASAEADAAFGDSRVYLERYLAGARHVEVQLLGDGEQLIHLGDRDCSVQRRQQKVIEEAPAPALDPALRRDLRAAAVTFGTHLKYQGLGTVEFLVDTRNAAFWFLEVNPRIQVEHPVTEAVTGLDLVAEQIAIAEGRGLRLRQRDIAVRGHAIECRICAEDPAADWRPHPGTVISAEFPAGPGIRVDTHVQAGSLVPPQYDGLLAKLIVSGASRDEALARLRAALARCRIDGVATTIGLHAAVAADPEFTAGGVDTGYLARFLKSNSRSLCILSSWIPRSATATRACGARPACAPRTSCRSRRC
jgi:acetyl-CoA carboxylase biotin carboxylase subunit